MKTAIRLMQYAVIVSGALWLPMCSSNDSDDHPAAAVPVPTATGGSSAVGGGGPGGAPTGAAAITIQNFNFNPLNMTVAAGTTVTVTNADTVPHTVTSEAAAGNFTPGAVAGVSFDTGRIQPGASASFTIPSGAPSGTMIPYYCAVHTSAMPQGTIMVQ